MMLIDNPSGNYRFLTGIAPYSSGVVAMSGFEIVHVRLRQPTPYRRGFEQIARHLAAAHRPRHALCGVELRLPTPLSFEGFAAFNGEYQQLLASWELLLNGRNPLARTNIAPAVLPPEEPSLYAFSYTAPSSDDATPPTFIVAGAGDLHDQANLSPAAIVRPDDTSDDALREKAMCVMQVMQARLDGLGVGWPDVTSIDVYTVYPLQPFLTDTVLGRSGEAAAHGIHWHFGHPPIEGLAFEMDLRGVRREKWIDLEALIARESSRQLAQLGGTERSLETPHRRRTTGA